MAEVQAASPLVDNNNDKELKMRRTERLGYGKFLLLILCLKSLNPLRCFLKNLLGQMDSPIDRQTDCFILPLRIQTYTARGNGPILVQLVGIHPYYSTGSSFTSAHPLHNQASRCSFSQPWEKSSCKLKLQG